MARSGLNNIISHDSATLQQLTSGKNRKSFSPSTLGSSKRTSNTKTGRRYRFRVRVRKACISLSKKAKAFSNFLKPNKRLTTATHSWIATDIRLPTVSSHTRSSTPSICVTRPTLRLHQVPPSPVPSQTSSSRRKNTRKSMRFSHPVVNAVIAGPARTPEPSVATAVTTDSWSTVNTVDLSGSTAPGTPNTVASADFQGQVNPKRVFRDSRANASFNTFKDVMDGVKAKPKPLPLPAQADAHADASAHANAFARTRAQAQAPAPIPVPVPAPAPAAACIQAHARAHRHSHGQTQAQAQAPVAIPTPAPAPVPTQVHAQAQAQALAQIPTQASSARPPSLPYIAAQPAMTLDASNNDSLGALAAKLQAQYVLSANGTAPAVIVVAHPSILQPGFRQPQQQPSQATPRARPHTVGNLLPYIPYNPRFNPYNAPTPNSPSPTLPPDPTTGLATAIAEADSAEEQTARKRHTTLYADVESGCIFPPPSHAPAPAPVIAPPPAPAPSPALVHTIKRKPVPARPTPTPVNTSKPLPPIPGPSDPRRFTGGIVPESIRMNPNGYPMIGKGKGKGKGWAADVGELERERLK